MKLKLEVQLSGNLPIFISMHLGYLSFFLAFGKRYCLLNSPSVFLLEENIIISDAENEGKERKWLTQHLTATSAVLKALRMGFLRVVQEADQHFSTSPVSKLGASQLCHLRLRSRGAVPRNQLGQSTSMLLCRQALSLLLRKACHSLWTCLENPAAGCSGRISSCWAAACSSSGSLSSSYLTLSDTDVSEMEARRDISCSALCALSQVRVVLVQSCCS